MKIPHVALGSALVLAALSIAPCFAAEKPVNVALVAPIQIVKQEDTVTAFSLNILYGKNAAVRGADIGLVNHTTAGMSKGLQWGFVNIAEADFTGAQLGAVNYNAGSFEGLQWGFVNHTMKGDGLQLGFVNFAQKIHGVQIGFINIISQDGFLPVFPIVNWSF